MAAIDPSAEVTTEGPARATLKLVKISVPDFGGDDSDDEDYEDDGIAAIERRLGLASEDDSDDSDEAEGVNGGPSDPTRSKKARTEALRKALEAGTNGDAMEDVTLANGANGKVDKGKAKVTDDSDDDSDDLEDDDDEEEIKEYVVCTLDPERVSREFHVKLGSDTNNVIALPATTRHYHQQRE